MSIEQASVSLLQRALMAWVATFTLFTWTGFDAANVLLRSPLLPVPGTVATLTHALAMFNAASHWGGVVLLVAPWLLFVLAAVQLVRRPRWYLALPTWWLYVNLMNTGWLAGSGGQQLVVNVLFWNILLCLPATGPGALAASVAFWTIRLQLVLAYAATGLHKLTGTHWVDGSAMGIVATDPAFGPAWLAGMPLLAKGATWAVLLFQLTFPVAVWWRATRIPWMVFGVLFHLATAWWLGIPEMALAFIAVYPIWLSGSEAGRCLPRRWGDAVTSAPAT
jgi:hypothetical protein